MCKAETGVPLEFFFLLHIFPLFVYRLSTKGQEGCAVYIFSNLLPIQKKEKEQERRTALKDPRACASVGDLLHFFSTWPRREKRGRSRLKVKNILIHPRGSSTLPKRTWPKQPDATLSLWKEVVPTSYEAPSAHTTSSLPDSHPPPPILVFPFHCSNSYRMESTEKESSTAFLSHLCFSIWAAPVSYTHLTLPTKRIV